MSKQSVPSQEHVETVLVQIILSRVFIFKNIYVKEKNNTTAIQG